MRKILQWLSTDGAFLYEEESFHVVDSEYIDSFGGTGNMVLSNGIIDLRLSIDRDRLLTEICGSGRTSPQAWFGLDVVRQHVTNEIATAVMDSDNVDFLRTHLKDIQQRFAKDSLQSTEAELKQLEKQRAKRLFG